MKFGAANGDTVFVALDDTHIGIGIFLITGMLAPVALGVGNTLGDAQVVFLDIVYVSLDPLNASGRTSPIWSAAVRRVMIEA